MAKSDRVRIPTGHRPRRHTTPMRDKRHRRAKDKLRKELTH